MIAHVALFCFSCLFVNTAYCAEPAAYETPCLLELASYQCAGHNKDIIDFCLEVASDSDHVVQENSVHFGIGIYSYPCR